MCNSIIPVQAETRTGAEGYQKPVEEFDDSDIELIAVYNRLADNSREFAAESSRQVTK